MKRSGPALSVQNLSKRFGDRVAFEDVTFEIGYGEVFGFLGPNGAGKTTTVRTLSTLISPTSGSATVAGIPLAPENGERIRQSISVMPESPGLYLRLTVAENREPGVLRRPVRVVGCSPERRSRPESGQPRRAGQRALRQAVQRSAPAGQSGQGFAQRRCRRDHEPTSGLDPAVAREVHDLIDGLRQRGVTIFLTTHRLEEAERLCDRVALLNTTPRAVGKPDELRERLFAKTLTVRTLAPIPDPDWVFGGLPAVDGWRQDGTGTYMLTVSDPAVAAPHVTRALAASGADVLSIAESRHSLEDVYLELIGEDTEAVPQ